MFYGIYDLGLSKKATFNFQRQILLGCSFGCDNLLIITYLTMKFPNPHRDNQNIMRKSFGALPKPLKDPA